FPTRRSSDLLARQAYDKGVTIDSLGLTLGTDFPVVVAIAADHLGKNPIDVQEHASFHRIGAELGSAALRAADLLRGDALARCGSHQCIGDGDPLDIGSIALTTIAFSE